MGYSFTLTPKDIYGVEEPSIPKGFTITGFRLPKVGDTIVTVRLMVPVELKDPGNVPMGPRLILEKLPEKRIVEISTCSTCPHRRSITGRNLQICSLIGAFLNEDYSIPPGCPLPKAT